MNEVKRAFGRWVRVLTFRATTADIEEFGLLDFFLGFLATWIVGMGRWWDDDGASPLQQTGAGSMIYVFVLALLLFLFGKMMLDEPPPYGKILVGIVYTAPPAIVYAIPIERWVDPASAIAFNAVALTFTAVYRVVMMLRLLRAASPRPSRGAILTILTPISLIVTILGFAHVAVAILESMGGLRDPPPETLKSIQSAANAIWCAWVIVFALCLVGWGYLVSERKSRP